MDPVTLMIALIYFIAGVICVQRPARLVEWLGKAVSRTTDGGRPSWLQGRGVIYFIRFIGALALLNAVTLFFSAYYR